MSDERIIEQIVKKHGEVINVRENPQVVIDILRRFGPVLDDPDGGSLPGGVPPSPPPGPTSLPMGDEPGNPEPPSPPAPTPAPGEPGNPSPGPAQFGTGPQLHDVMKEVLRLSRSVDELHAKLDARQQR
jgi:hypothetical protein